MSLLCLGSLLLLNACEPQQKFEQRLLQFGTIIDITLIHDDLTEAERAFVDIEQTLKQYETYWHAWQDSDLYRFNRSLNPQTPVPVPESLVDLISLSQAYYKSSGQLFNPALGKLIAAYGFHDSSSRDEQLINEIRLDLPTMQDLKINNDQAISLNPYLELDFGGIAKGYAMGKIAAALKADGFQNFLINAGGDVLTSGQSLDSDWLIAIQDPFASGAIASIRLSGDRQLFTSGNYQRFYRQGKDIVHHIIDPRSGRPSGDITSATVLTADAVLADVAATTLMIDGWKNHDKLSNSLGINDYLIVNQSGQIIVSKSMSAKINFLIDQKKVEIR